MREEEGMRQGKARYETRREGIYGRAGVARRWVATRWVGTRWVGTRWVGTRWVGTRWVGALVLQLEREIPVAVVEGVGLVSVGATILEE
jgi:hypothetical protein